MQLQIDLGWLLTVFLVFIRISVLFVMSPVFSSLGGLITIRVLLTLALSALLVSGQFAVQMHAPATLSVLWLILAAASELIVGLSMAFGVFAAFGAFSVAGKVLDIQAGFGIGNVYDPVTRAGSPMFSSLLNMVALAAFFGMDGHHAMLRGIAFSLQQVAPGTGLADIALEPVLRQFGLMFSLGVALIIPVMIALLLVEAGLAVISRTLPQMNVFVVGVPVKIIAALGMFALSVGSLGPVMGKIFASIFVYWQDLLR